MNRRDLFRLLPALGSGMLLPTCSPNLEEYDRGIVRVPMSTDPDLQQLVVRWDKVGDVWRASFMRGSYRGKTDGT